MYPQPAARTYYPALDFLRGLAISIVVIYHNFSSLSFFRFGWMGVDLFFVLSGFLITDLLLKSRENKFFFRNFYIRRILRIFPLYYLVLVSFFLLSPHLFSQKGPNTTFSYYNENKAWFWSYFQNWLMVHKGPAPVPFLSHFWSLAVEEQFYVLWPVLIFFIRGLDNLKKAIYVLLGVALIIRVCTWMLHPEEVEVFYCNTFTRMDSLLAGCFLAVHLRQGKEISPNIIKLVVLGFTTLIVASLAIFGNVRQDNLLFPTIGYSISAAFFAVTLYLLIRHETYILPWLKHLKALSFVGKISYGMYVYHLPIYLLLSYLFSRILDNGTGSPSAPAFLISLGSLLLTVIASTLSFYFLEKPILNLKKHFP
ncbi:MAG: acyltransferase family protein [Flavisolibacter sp.]